MIKGIKKAAKISGNKKNHWCNSGKRREEEQCWNFKTIYGG
jgi:hypothetical protein